MTHVISGFIAKENELERYAKKFSRAKIATLRQGYGFLVWSYDLSSEVHEKYKVFNTDQKVGIEISKLTPVAYVETDYFGGFGEQNATVWREGKKKTYKRKMFGPIDQALADIGVQSSPTEDEFDALGLGNHRTNDDWLEIADYCGDDDWVEITKEDLDFQI